jgi:predicted ATP-grasp superfamily ATP-dependent carboligase
VRNEILEELSIRVCRDIGYRGVADLDWRFDRRDARYKLVDFNPRMGAQFKLFETEAGIDVLRALHLDLTGRPVPQSPPRYGKGIKIENLDLPAWFAYRSGHAAAPPRAEVGPRSERAWFASDDPLPFLAMAVRFAGPALARLASFVVPRRRHKRPGAPRSAEVLSDVMPATAPIDTDVSSANGHAVPTNGNVPARRLLPWRKRVESSSTG